MKKSTERFTQTVEAYIKYRPGYPDEVLQTLIRNCGLTNKSIIADIGSGTGLLTELMLKNGNRVYGVEPNSAMREAGEQYLANYHHSNQFISVNGTAEATTLPSRSIDIITVATAFHWFDAVKTKIEFQRIIKPEGWVLLVWNVRDKDSALIQEYEQLITDYGTDYCQTAASHFDKPAVAEFFAPNPLHTKSIKNSQHFDWEGLQGRVLSTSYCPSIDDPKYHAMMQQLRVIYDRYQQHGFVEFLYQTKLYYGHISNL